MSIVLTAAVATGILYFGNKTIIDNILAYDTKIAMNAIIQKTEALKESSLEVATQLSQDGAVQTSVESGDKTEIISVANFALQRLWADTDFVTITDSNGVVIARTHSDSSGDSITNQQNIREALNGNNASYVEPGTVVKLSVRSSAPIKNANGQIIGAVSTCYKLDNTDFVDDLKAATGTEITVFFKTMKESIRQLKRTENGK